MTRRSSVTRKIRRCVSCMFSRLSRSMVVLSVPPTFAFSGGLTGYIAVQSNAGGANFRHFHDVYALRLGLHGLHKSHDHLIEGDQAKPLSASSRERKPFRNLVKRDEGRWPAVAGAQNIPGAEDGGIQVSFPDQVFALAAHGDVGLHHRSRMRHAEVDEVPHLELRR